MIIIGITIFAGLVFLIVVSGMTIFNKMNEESGIMSGVNTWMYILLFVNLALLLMIISYTFYNTTYKRVGRPGLKGPRGRKGPSGN
tara:strand:- start:286 stop:543 length:258 start_codon:yes stop_codon:yes gene_type:complete